MQIVAAILAIAGIVMMTYADGFHSHAVIGIALVVGSASMSALYKVGAGSALAGPPWPGWLGALREPWMELVLEGERPAPRASRCADCSSSWLWLSRPFHRWPHICSIWDKRGGRRGGSTEFDA